MAILHFTDPLMRFNNNMIILCIIDSCHVVFQITTLSLYSYAHPTLEYCCLHIIEHTP